MESKRQKQVGKIIHNALSEIFQMQMGEILGQSMVTIISVNMTPDLLIAKVYLSIYNSENPNDVLKVIETNNKGIRRLMGNQIRNKVRMIPELMFFRDDSMDEVVKMDKLFKEIKQKDEEVKELRENSDFIDTNPYKEEG
ncbi:MAG: 30S ribosome-binding factor RbfA [Chitinophagales bacterium]|nr:30S ribosome-binding factor RbfA [Chitinophagales bacterium]